MKFRFLALALTILPTIFSSTNALAVPGRLYVASPKKIEVVGGKVRLHYRLPCRNDHPDEWAGTLVAVWDDEGDQMIALGTVLAQSSCDPGPLKSFVFDYPVAKVISESGMDGYITPENIESGMFEPVDVRK
jgi:hypothetical protein